MTSPNYLEIWTFGRKTAVASRDCENKKLWSTLREQGMDKLFYIFGNKRRTVTSLATFKGWRHVVDEKRTLAVLCKDQTCVAIHAHAMLSATLVITSTAIKEIVISVEEVSAAIKRTNYFTDLRPISVISPKKSTSEEKDSLLLHINWEECSDNYIPPDSSHRINYPSSLGSDLSVVVNTKNESHSDSSVVREYSATNITEAVRKNEHLQFSSHSTRFDSSTAEYQSDHLSGVATSVDSNNKNSEKTNHNFIKSFSECNNSIPEKSTAPELSWEECRGKHFRSDINPEDCRPPDIHKKSGRLFNWSKRNKRDVIPNKYNYQFIPSWEEPQQDPKPSDIDWDKIRTSTDSINGIVIPNLEFPVDFSDRNESTEVVVSQDQTDTTVPDSEDESKVFAKRWQPHCDLSKAESVTSTPPEESESISPAVVEKEDSLQAPHKKLETILFAELKEVQSIQTADTKVSIQEPEENNFLNDIIISDLEDNRDTPDAFLIPGDFCSLPETIPKECKLSARHRIVCDEARQLWGTRNSLSDADRVEELSSYQINVDGEYDNLWVRTTRGGCYSKSADVLVSESTQKDEKSSETTHEDCDNQKSSQNDVSDVHEPLQQQNESPLNSDADWLPTSRDLSLESKLKQRSAVVFDMSPPLVQNMKYKPEDEQALIIERKEHEKTKEEVRILNTELEKARGEVVKLVVDKGKLLAELKHARRVMPLNRSQLQQRDIKPIQIEERIIPKSVDEFIPTPASSESSRANNSTEVQSRRHSSQSSKMINISIDKTRCLTNADLLHSDIYVHLVCSDAQEFFTSVKYMTVRPVWEEVFTIPQTIVRVFVKARSFNKKSSDVVLGIGYLRLQDQLPTEVRDNNIQLTDDGNSKTVGSLLVRTFYGQSSELTPLGIQNYFDDKKEFTEAVSHIHVTPSNQSDVKLLVCRSDGK